MTKEKIITGYTTGVFDLFHIGHLNVLKQAKSMCDRLIIAVTSDELAERLKGKRPVIPFNERIEIVQCIKYVDLAVVEDRNDKIGAWEKYKFDVIFKGDDWKGTEKWNILEKEFNLIGVRVIYFPYTNCTSSTLILNILEGRINNSKELY